MAKALLNEILEIQKSVLDNLDKTSVIALSDNDMIEVIANGKKKITSIHINEELLKTNSLEEVMKKLTQTINIALDMALEVEVRETNRIMDAYSPAIFDILK
jgi:DNA-binding protein YbaB